MQIHEEIRHFIQHELARDVAHVRDTGSLLEAGVIDSLGVVALVSFIQKRYGIDITEDEMMPENFDSIGAIVSFVTEKRRSRNG